MKKQIYIPALLLSSALAFVSCKKDTKTPEEETPSAPSGPSYTIPTSYTFASCDYSTSTQRLAMTGEMITYIRTAHTTTASPVLSAQKLKDMYSNAASQYTDATLNSSGIQLKDKTSNSFSLQTDLEASFDDLGTITATTPTASSGTGGKLISGTKAYIVDANGFEHKEFLEKGAMGGIFYYQATTLLTNIGTFDNTTSTSVGTAQEHAWDEAFGYFGVPVTFPTSTVGVKYWGSYCNAVNSVINSNSTIMNAFLKGRAAISNKDYTARDEAKDVILKTWEKIGAARFITYVKQAKTNFADDAVRNHSLSEAVGFIRGFRYNPSKTISDTQINQLLGYFGNNLYNVTTTNMDNAINLMASVFNLDPNAL